MIEFLDKMFGTLTKMFDNVDKNLWIVAKILEIFTKTIWGF